MGDFIYFAFAYMLTPLLAGILAGYWLVPVTAALGRLLAGYAENTARKADPKLAATIPMLEPRYDVLYYDHMGFRCYEADELIWEHGVGTIPTTPGDRPITMHVTCTDMPTP